MEDSFRVRVDKAFGALLTSPPPSDSTRNHASSLSLSSLWCLTDDEIQRKEWNRDFPGDRDLDDPAHYPPNLDGFVFANNNNHTGNDSNAAQTDGQSSFQNGSSSSDLNQQLETDLHEIEDLWEDDDEDMEPSPKCKRLLGSPDDDDDSNIRSSIGLDCTLDYEEEEDEYDKVAVGQEKAGDHLYLRDATGYGIDANTYTDLPNTVEDFVRDPRADHAAATLRIKEDAEAAGNFDLLKLSDSPETMTSIQSADTSSRKSIIKKREVQKGTKTQKRVRFNNSLQGNCCVQDEKAPSLDVPDYIRNPSNYTHYTFDAAPDLDDGSNRKAYLDFFSLVRKSGMTETQLCQEDMADYPAKSINFNVKKDKKNQIKNSHANEGRCLGVRITLLSDEAREEDTAMEEDCQEIAVDRTKSMSKVSRQYRAKAHMYFDDE